MNNEKLYKVIFDRLKKEYLSLESSKERFEFALKYAGRYNLSKFLLLMEDMELTQSSGKANKESELAKLLDDPTFQKETVLNRLTTSVKNINERLESVREKQNQYEYHTPEYQEQLKKEISLLEQKNEIVDKSQKRLLNIEDALNSIK